MSVLRAGIRRTCQPSARADSCYGQANRQASWELPLKRPLRSEWNDGFGADSGLVWTAPRGQGSL